jgi:hypothetical protein
MGPLEPLISKIAYDEFVDTPGVSGNSMTLIKSKTRYLIKYDGTKLTINGKESELKDVPKVVDKIILGN